MTNVLCLSKLLFPCSILLVPVHGILIASSYSQFLVFSYN